MNLTDQQLLALIRDRFASISCTGPIEIITERGQSNEAWLEAGSPTSLIRVDSKAEPVAAFVDISYGRMILVYSGEVFISHPGATVLVTDKHVLIWKDYYGSSTELYKAI